MHSHVACEELYILLVVSGSVCWMLTIEHFLLGCRAVVV